MLHCTQRGFEKVCFQAGIVGQKRKKTKKQKQKWAKKFHGMSVTKRKSSKYILHMYSLLVIELYKRLPDMHALRLHIIQDLHW